MGLPVVALIGRPNVGKSTLFNALTRSRDALVSDFPGLTRDRHYGRAQRGERVFLVVDTGGISDDEEAIARMTREQALLALEECDVVALLVDARAGIVADDAVIARTIRSSGKPCMLLINKSEGLDHDAVRAEFSELGFADVHPIAASTQRGVDSAVEQIEALLPPPEPVPEEDSSLIRVAVIGRPNAGKSTLINRLLGENRLIASDQPGTTRDAIDVPLERDGKRFVFVDTAGVRRRARVEDVIEKFSVIKALNAIERAHVCVVLVDAQDGVSEQDATLLGHVLEAGRALVIALNKWDRMDADEREWATRELARRLDFCAFAERPTISGLYGSGFRELIAAVVRAYRSATREVPGSKLNKALEKAVAAHQPAMSGGRAPKLKFCHMGGTLPPRIVIHGSRTGDLSQSYRRYLENFFRAEFKMVGTPIRLDFKDGENPYAGRKNVLTERQIQKRKRLMKHVKGR
jgi:GTPase